MQEGAVLRLESIFVLDRILNIATSQQFKEFLCKIVVPNNILKRKKS